MSQDLFLDNTSIKENIVLNEIKIDYKKYKKALEFSQSEEFINKLKNKDETKIMNNGANISGGQRQRLVLARSFYHAKDLLILDECTSSLDRNTERKILKNLKKYCRNMIVIFITHKKFDEKIFNKKINLK